MIKKFFNSDIMIVIILLSLLPLVFPENETAIIIELFVTAIFVFEYIYNYQSEIRKNIRNLWKYPFSLWAIIDLLAIIPVFLEFFGSRALSGLRALKLLKLMRLTRIAKIFRRNKTLMMIFDVFIEEQESLLKLFVLLVSFIMIGALVVFTFEYGEPGNQFTNYFDALWWAFVTATTIGYGDIVPVTFAGQMMTILMSLINLALFALPVSIISAGIIRKYQIEEENKKLELTDE